MKFKRVLSAVAALAMLGSCLTSCGGDDKSSTTSKADNSKSDASKTDDKKDSSGDKELTVWSISTESDSFHGAYEQAIKDFEASHPGVKVNHETFENESYKTKIKTAVAAKDLPDVYFSWAGGFTKTFVDSGAVLDVTSAYNEKYKSDLPEAAVSNLMFDGKLYGSCMTTPVSCMWYNKKIFDENGVKVPETVDEFVEACQKLVDAGVTPIATSVKDVWVLCMLHDALTLKSVGPEKLAKTLNKEGGDYMDPDFLKSVETIKKLQDMKAFIPGATALSNDEAQQEFFGEQAAMYFTGSWMGGSIVNDCKGREADFDVAPVPVVNPANAKLTDFMGGGSDSLLVSAYTDEPDLATELAFEICKGVSHYGYIAGAGIPAWKIDYDDSEVPDITKKVAAYAAGATSFTLWFDTLLVSDDAEKYKETLQNFYTGDLSPEDFQKEMAKILG